MDYHICPTSTEQREAAKGDYIVVMNRNVKAREKLGKFAVVKYLFVNRENDLHEYREMLAIAKTVTDDSLPDDCICMDQSIRNAVGIPFGDVKNVTVRLCGLKLSLGQKIYDFVYPGNYVFARVHKPDVVDIEKNLCRMKSDTIQILGALEGKTILFEKPVSMFELQVGKDFSKCSGDTQEAFVKRFGPYAENIDSIDFADFMEIEGCHTGCKCIYDFLKNDAASQNEKNRILSSLYEICDWYIDSQCIRSNMKIPVFPLQSESYERMQSIMQSQEEISFFSRYPDAEKIFHVKPDIGGVYMDKYFRDKLHCDLLDCVRIKRNKVAVIMNEIMDYGLMFALSIVAVMLSFFGQNRIQNLVSICVALGITLFFTMKRTK